MAYTFIDKNWPDFTALQKTAYAQLEKDYLAQKARINEGVETARQAYITALRGVEDGITAEKEKL
ncbi:MAG: hypothetical protein ACYTEQ_19470 [Planctomycetota bacterium]